MGRSNCPNKICVHKINKILGKEKKKKLGEGGLGSRINNPNSHEHAHASLLVKEQSLNLYGLPQEHRIPKCRNEGTENVKACKTFCGGKWLWPPCGFANHLAPIVCFISVSGEMLGIIGRGPSISKSNQLHVDIFRFSLSRRSI